MSKLAKVISVMSTLTFGLSLFSFAPAPAAEAATVSYTADHVFSINDVQGDEGLWGTDVLDMANPVMGAKDGLTYYAIDGAYGNLVKDFDSASVKNKPMDGIYDDGLVANIYDATGNVTGLSVQNAETANWKAGPRGGSWMKGLGGLKAKCATEHYVVMQHLFEDPAFPGTLVDGIDYNWKVKDDGNNLYYWGNANQEPNQIWLYSTITLPEAWKQPGANFTVTSAKLIIDHNITNSPNDQIRPEDFENEFATGILPSYTVDPATGEWLSAVDSYEGGDGEFLPAGTVLQDVYGQKTNAWYVTLDRDPFGGDNPRWRLKSSKYGQDLPGVELSSKTVKDMPGMTIPTYEAGTPTTTTIDLLSRPELKESANWNAYLDNADEAGTNLDPIDKMTYWECKLTPDFDLMLYIKGEVGKPTILRNAKLVIEYEDPNAPVQTPVDVAITSFNVTADVVEFSLVNNIQGDASGTVYLVAKDSNGLVVDELTQPFQVGAQQTQYRLNWNPPQYSTDVTWTATVSVDSGLVDNNPENNVSTTVISSTEYNGDRHRDRNHDRDYDD